MLVSNRNAEPSADGTVLIHIVDDPVAAVTVGRRGAACTVEDAMAFLRTGRVTAIRVTVAPRQPATPAGHRTTAELEDLAEHQVDEASVPGDGLHDWTGAAA